MQQSVLPRDTPHTVQWHASAGCSCYFLLAVHFQNKLISLKFCIDLIWPILIEDSVKEVYDMNNLLYFLLAITLESLV